MSDKIYLKEITLPIVETGENETYSFVQTDADLDTAGDAADAKKVGDEISDLKQDLEGLDVYTLGLYPQMSVADTTVASFTDGADDIPVKSLTVDITPVQDLHGQDAPYPAGGGANKYNVDTAILGKWISSNGEVSNASYGSVSANIPVTGGSACGLKCFGNTPASMSICEYKGDDVFITRTHGTSNALTATLDAETEYVKVQFSVDATLTISKGDLEGFKPVFYLGSTAPTVYAPYSNICPISGWTGANVSVFDVNVWDEEWESGMLNATTGAEETNPTAIRSKNYIPILPNTSYYFNIPGSWFRIIWYDNAKEVISGEQETTKLKTSPSNAHFMRFCTNAGYGANYNHDVSINYPSTDHDYHAYKGNVYPISFPTEAGTVYGGTLDVTSGVLRVTNGYVDLGTLDWSRGASVDGTGYYYFNSDGVRTLIKKDYTNIIGICSKYSWHGWSGRTLDNICINGDGYLYVYPNDYQSADATTFKAAMSGVQLAYELATPVTYQLTPTEVATILGQNNIFADTGDIAELTYRADLKAYIDAHVGS